MLHDKSTHRWFVFPHSFAPELVHGLIDEWGLDSQDTILDPFAGAGTTILGAKERGVPAIGYDLSPLAVLVARTKVAPPRAGQVRAAWARLQPRLTQNAALTSVSRTYPRLVAKALPGRILPAFELIKQQILTGLRPGPTRDFFLLALLATIPAFSRATASGGWLKWIRRHNSGVHVPAAFASKLQLMRSDLYDSRMPSREPPEWAVKAGDARELPDGDGSYSAVITSPPYPNRHDYSRVFGVELMFGFLDWAGTRRLRYQSFHSHPEARPTRRGEDAYERPPVLSRIVEAVRSAGTDPRVPAMLDGYFLDMYLCLKEARRVCRPGSRLGFVVGNAQYHGIGVPVDELTADAGEQVGLRCRHIIILRYRGNSAQQMASFGRCPARESLVIFQR